MKLAAAAAAVLLLGAACAREAAPPTSMSSQGGQELRIEESTQARVDADLAIGAGNFLEEDGRLSCGLWLTSPGGGGLPQEHVRVTAGQVVERAGRRIEVVDVSRQGGKGTVVLRVSKP